MKVIYALEDLSNLTFPILFAAGGTPRSDKVKSWRPLFLKTLSNFNYNGTVLIPETNDGKWKQEYNDQIDWEQDGMEKADLITFWMPRDLKDMPCFTSNIEAGLYLKSGKILYGRPEEAPKNKYLDYSYRKFCKKEPYNNMYDLAKYAIKFLNDRITPYADPVEALKALFMRENILSLQDVHYFINKETKFTHDDVIRAMKELMWSGYITYKDFNFVLNKEKIIKDIIE